MRKIKIAAIGFVVAATPLVAPPAFAQSGHDYICSHEATSFNTWFYQQFYC